MQKAIVLSIALVLGAGATAAAPQRHPGPDPLDAKISLSAAGETLDQILRRMGKSARYPLAGGPHGGDRRFYLFCSERPLREVLERIRNLIRFPPGGAQLYISGSSRVLDEDLASNRARARAAARLRRERLAQAQKHLEQVKEWSQGEPATPFPNKDDLAQVAAYIRIFEGLPESTRDRAFLGQPILIPLKNLPPPARAAFSSALFGDWRRPRAERNFGGRDKALQQRSLMMSPHPGAPEGFPSMQIVLFDSERLSGSGWGDLLNVPLAGEVSGGPGWGQVYARRKQSLRRGPAGMERIPALQRPFVWHPRNDRPEAMAQRLLPRVAELAEIPLVGEFDPCITPSVMPGLIDEHLFRLANWTKERGSRKSLPLWEVIEAACQDLQLNWDYKEGWLIIRSPRIVEGWAGLTDLRPAPLPPLPATEK